MMPTRTKIWGVRLLFVLSLALIIRVNPVIGTTLVKQNISSLSQMAALVVEGDVLKVRSAWNAEHTQIHTYITLDVTDVYAGKGTRGRMEIRILGGAVGDTAMIIPGAPRFAESEHLVLFLYDDPGLLIPVVGLHQGKLSTSLDSKTGQKVVGNPQVGFFDRQELKTSILEARERR